MSRLLHPKQPINCARAVSSFVRGRSRAPLCPTGQTTRIKCRWVQWSEEDVTVDRKCATLDGMANQNLALSNLVRNSCLIAVGMMCSMMC